MKRAALLVVSWVIIVGGMIGEMRESRAALPALALVAFDAAEMMVVRSVGRAVVVNVGTAANDAAWATTLGSWTANGWRIGSIAMRLNGGATAEIQVAQNEPLTQGPAVSGYQWQLLTAPASHEWNANSCAATGMCFWDVAASQAEALDVAIGRLGAVTMGTCVVYTGWVDYSVVMPGHDWATIRCVNPGSWSGDRLFKVAVTKVAGQYEGRDGIIRFITDGYSWKRDDSDPDVNVGPITSSAYWQSGAIHVSQLASFEDEEGNERQTELQIAPGGLAMRAADVVAQGQTQVREVSTDAALHPATFTAYQSGLAPGQLPGVNAPNTTTDPTPGTGTGTGTVTVQFPPDYARQGEAGAASLPIQTKLDTLHDDLTKNVDVPDPVTPTNDELKAAWFGSTFAGLIAWRLPAHASVCPTMTIDTRPVIEGTYVIDGHCQMWVDHAAGLVGVVMTMVWTMAALFIVLRA